MTGREPVTATGAGAAGVVGVAVGAGVVGVGVGVAVGVFMQVQVGVGVAVAVPVSVAVAVAVVVECVSPGFVDAIAECEANRTAKLVAASVMLASPAILARLVVFQAVTRCLLGCDKNRARGQ